MSGSPVDRALVEQARSFSVTALSDALDSLGFDGGLRGIRPLAPGMRCAGPAFTVRFEPVPPGQSAPAANYIDEVPPGSVVLLDNGGLTRCTVWGDILTAVALARGVAGTVVHGCCRDAAGIRALGYPLFSVSAFMKSGKNRVRMQAVQVPVQIGEALVRPGDLLVGDDDGVLAIPAEQLAATLEVARQVAEMEGRVLEAVKAGSTLAAARAANQYDRFSLRGRT